MDAPERRLLAMAVETDWGLYEALPPLRGDKTLSDLIIEERDESLRRYEWFSEDRPG